MIFFCSPKASHSKNLQQLQKVQTDIPLCRYASATSSLS